MAAASISAIPPHIEQALKRAARATGADFNYLLKTAQRESALRPGAKAKSSTATGLFQFIEQTWLSTLKDSGSRHGLGKVSDAITRNAAGRYNVADPAMRRAILAMRLDPKLSAVMAGEFTKKNAEALKANIGRPPSDGELYIGHFLGAKNASKLIKLALSDPQSPAAQHFSRAAKANRSIFYARSGRPRTVREVYQNLTRQYGRQIADAQSPGVKRKVPATGSVASSQEANKARRSEPLRPLTHALFTIWQTPLDGTANRAETSAFHNLFLPAKQGTSTDLTRKYSESRTRHLPTHTQLLAAFGVESVNSRKTENAAQPLAPNRGQNESEISKKRISDLWGRTSPSRHGVLKNKNPGGI